MKHLLFFSQLFLLSILNPVLSQEKLLTKANRNIFEKKFDDASEQLDKFKSKDGSNNATELLEIKLSFYKNSSIKELENCNLRLTKLHADFKSNPILEIPKYYDEIGLVSDSIYRFSEQIKNQIIAHYLKSTDINELDFFITNYNSWTETKIVINVRDSLLFSKLKISPEITPTEEFIAKYPVSIYADSAKFILEKFYFNQSITENKSESYRTFLRKYPKSNFKNVVQEKLEELEWNLTFGLNSRTAFESFLKEFPNSTHKTEINQAIEELEWQRTLAANQKANYEAFLKEFSNSIHKNEINLKLEDFSWKEVLAKNSKVEYGLFLKEFPNSTHIDEIKLKLSDLELTEYNQAVNSNSIESLKLFKSNYPNSSYLTSIEAKLKDLQSLVLPFLGADRKYRLYDVLTNQFTSLKSFDSFSFLPTGQFLLTSDTLLSVVDQKGKEIIPFQYSCISNTKMNQYLVFSKGKYGLFSNSGKKITETIYDEISDNYSAPYYSISKGRGKTIKYGVIDSTGKVIIPAIYSSVQEIYYQSKSDIFILNMNGLNQLTNIKSNLKIGKPYKEMYSLDSIYMRVSDGKLYGVIDLGGKEIIPIKWKELQLGKSGQFIVRNNQDEVGIIDFNQQVLFPFQTVYSAYHLDKDLYSVDLALNPTSSIIMIYNSSLKSFVSGKETYRSVSKIDTGLYMAEINRSIKIFSSKWELMKELINVVSQETVDSYENSDESLEDYPREGDGEGMFEEEYSYGCYLYSTEATDQLSEWKAIPNNDVKLKPIYIDGKWGYIDGKLNISIPLKYAIAGDFHNGLAEVQEVTSDGLYVTKIIDENGTIILDSYSVYGWSRNNPDLFLVSNSYSGNFAWYNKRTKELNLLDQEIQNLKTFNSFKIYTYRDAQVFETIGGERLIDENISFSNYYAEKLKESAISLKNEKRYNEAISKLNEALKYNINQASIYLLLAECYSEKGDDNNALNQINLGLEYKDDITLLSKRIDINIKNSQFAIAADDYFRCAELAVSETYAKSSIASYYFHAGYQYLNAEKNQEAINAINLGMKYDNSAAWAYNNRGVAYSRQSKIELALKDYVAAINKCSYCDDESHGLYYNNAANILYRLDRYTEACNYFEKAAEKSGKFQADYDRNCY
jgi:tetratricopeptide (TPR) repeat protein/outer membrane protein assembly factor BamD (BamD/ComL family)